MERQKLVEIHKMDFSDFEVALFLEKRKKTLYLSRDKQIRQNMMRMLHSAKLAEADRNAAASDSDAPILKMKELNDPQVIDEYRRKNELILFKLNILKVKVIPRFLLWWSVSEEVL